MKSKLSLFQSSIFGVAGNAPAYGVAVATAALVGAVGQSAPIAVLLCGIVMIGILLAYKKLNEDQASCGAAYTWVSKLLNPSLGFYAGWCLMVALVFFMVSATLAAGQATVNLLNLGSSEDKLLVTFCAAIWLIIVTIPSVLGVKFFGRFQTLLTVVEILVVFFIGIVISVNHGKDLVEYFTSNWQIKNLFTADFFSTGIVIAIFFLWGWDVIFNLSEETENTEKTSAHAGLISIILLIIIYTFFSLAAGALIPQSDISSSGNNMLFALATKILPYPYNYIAVLAFLISVLGSLDASFIQFSRTVVAKSRDGIFHHKFSQMHPQWGTPHLIIFLNAIIVLLLLIGSYVYAGVEEVILAGVGVSSVFVAYYYGFTGIACARFFYRKQLAGIVNNFLYVFWPLLAASVFFGSAIYFMIGFNAINLSVIVSSMLLGVIFIAMNHRRKLRNI